MIHVLSKEKESAIHNITLNDPWAGFGGFAWGFVGTARWDTSWYTQRIRPVKVVSTGCLPGGAVVTENPVVRRCAIVPVFCQGIANETTWGKDDENIGGFRQVCVWDGAVL